MQKEGECRDHIIFDVCIRESSALFKVTMNVHLEYMTLPSKSSPLELSIFSVRELGYMCTRIVCLDGTGFRLMNDLSSVDVTSVSPYLSNVLIWFT